MLVRYFDEGLTFWLFPLCVPGKDCLVKFFQQKRDQSTEIQRRYSYYVGDMLSDETSGLSHALSAEQRLCTWCKLAWIFFFEGHLCLLKIILDSLRLRHGWFLLTNAQPHFKGGVRNTTSPYETWLSSKPMLVWFNLCNLRPHHWHTFAFLNF